MILARALDWFAKRITGEGSQISVIAIGDGSTPPSDDDTALEHEISRQTAEVRVSDNKVVISGSFSISGNATVSEAGVFLEDGTLIIRSTFAPISVKSGDYLIIRFVIEFGR